MSNIIFAHFGFIMSCCAYCGFQSKNDDELGYHFYKFHKFDKICNLLCPVCQFESPDVLAHFKTYHRDRCCFCANYLSSLHHERCNQILKTGQTNYCYFSIFQEFAPNSK